MLSLALPFTGATQQLQPLLLLLATKNIHSIERHTTTVLYFHTVKPTHVYRSYQPE